ncbi:hypothetical protein phig1ep62 [Lactobacillus phage phig1e]|uniref:hypothetical protein n=1 Tax=Lactobacillus phage phig1e TaxID=52979 RepID=UPI000009B7DD|nr:hypothetical protein phig1ep62 [Lactobacillus phage phig1e]pir/T13176/ hypothetical protein L100 - Lactobacillus phage phi-gle [Lactobacillus phage phi-gle]CAA66781.1 Lorf100 [Lactobacillus phage phig1e]
MPINSVSSSSDIQNVLALIKLGETAGSSSMIESTSSRLRFLIACTLFPPFLEKLIVLFAPYAIIEHEEVNNIASFRLHCVVRTLISSFCFLLFWSGYKIL